MPAVEDNKGNACIIEDYCDTVQAHIEADWQQIESLTLSHYALVS